MGSREIDAPRNPFDIRSCLTDNASDVCGMIPVGGYYRAEDFPREKGLAIVIC
jgi:hypothetical protein